MPQYLARRCSPTDTGVVVWYTLNQYHAVRPEEWLAAWVARIDFELLPRGSADGNRAPDLPLSITAGAAAEDTPHAAQAVTV